jgi:hypothetical protein
MSARLFLACGIVSILLMNLAFADEKAASPKPLSPEEIKQAFAWFDTLGFPDLSKCRFVRVSKGDDEDGPVKRWDRGTFAFLVKDDGPTFRVFTIGLETETYNKTEEGTPDHLRVGYDAADLKKEVAKALEQLQRNEAGEFKRLFGLYYLDAKGLFVLARACAGQRHAELAQRLLEQAQKHAGSGASSLRQFVSDEIAAELMDRTINAMSQPEVSRKDVLAQFEVIVKHYPQSDLHLDEKPGRPLDWLGRHAVPAKAAVAMLKGMVAEDEARARKPPKPDREMTKRERIAELIYRLRDQQGRQLCFPGPCDIFGDFNPLGVAQATTAQQLADLEYEAIPQLVAALNDKRFTRATEPIGRFDSGQHVLRVGDCAYRILERIAARSFGHSDSALAVDDDEKAAARQKTLEAWWKEFQQKGEKRMLIEGVELGDNDSPKQAERLMYRYPAVAFDTMAKGVSNAKGNGIRSQLIQLIALDGDERAIALFRKELKGPFLGSRMTAARALLAKEHDDGVEAMIQEWRDRLKHGEKEEYRDSDELIEFLVSCNRLDTLGALAENLRKRPVSVRFEVIKSVYMTAPRGGVPFSNTHVLVEELLVNELDDMERREGLRLAWDNKKCRDPRLCDIAGHVLSRYWQEPDWFDLAGSLKTRERQRVELKNVWRISRGLPPLPLPPRESDQ